MEIEIFLEQLLTRLKDIDALILYSLLDKTPQFGISVTDIMDELDIKNGKVYEAINRLMFAGTIDYVVMDNFRKFFLTDIGRELIVLLE